MQKTLLLTLFLLSSCHVGRTVIWNFAAYDDYKKFDRLDVAAADAPPTFQFDKTGNRTVPIADAGGAAFLQDKSFEEFLTDNHTTSFLVLKGDTVIYENYFNGYSPDAPHSVYSVSKSFISLLVGIALEEGKITSLADPVKKYNPELTDSEIADVTLQELIDMESGIDFSELYYNPFGDLAKYFYGTNLKKYMRQAKLKNESKKFDYVSVNTDLLGWVLESATGQSIADYLQEKVWQPLEMQYDASWSLDSKKHGTPKFSFGLNMHTSDLLKLGYLYKHGGSYCGERIVGSAWVNRIAQVEAHKNGQPNYKNHWWRETAYKKTLNAAEKDRVLQTFAVENAAGSTEKNYRIFTGNYYAAGFLGQFVYVNPDRDVVIVRTGAKQGKTDWVGLFGVIAADCGTGSD